MVPQKKPEFSPVSIARMLWKQKLMIAAAAILGCAAAIIIVLRLPAIYQTDALVLVDSQKIPEHYVESTVNTNVQDRLATISQQILSTTRLQKIIDNFGLYSKERKTLVQEEIIELMRKDITIKLERGWTGNQPGAFHVGYQGQNPSLVADVANQLANLFIEENLRTRERQAEGTADFIDNQLAEAKKTLDNLEAKLSQYKVQHNGELPQQESFLSQALSRLQVELAGNQDALNRAQQNKTMLESALNIAEAEEEVLAKPPEPTRSLAVSAEGAVVAKPVAKSDLLQQQYDSLALRYKPNFPEMQALKAEIEREQKAEQENEAETAAPMNPTSPDENATAPAMPPSRELMHARERVELIKSQLGLAGQEIAVRNSERQQIMHDITIYQARIEQLPLREQEMAGVMRNYEISKDNYKSLLDKKLAAGMATDMEHRQQAERFTLLDPASVPGKPTRPKRVALSLLGCLVSVALALSIGLGREFKENTILGEWEIVSDLPVLGRIPIIKPELQPGTASSGRQSRRLWLALASAAILAILAMGAAGAHFYLRWF